MSLLGKIKKSQEAVKEVEAVEDKIHGGFSPIESNIYDATISLAFLKESTNGALGLEIHADLEDGSKYSESIYFSNVKQEMFYTDKKTGKEKPLPGFITCNDLALLSTGEDLEDLADSTESKMIELYNKDAEAKVPTEVEAITAMHGKKIKLGIQKQESWKQDKNEATGQWENTDEVVISNAIDRVFDEDGFTVAELIAEKEDPEFIDIWIETYKGELVNKKRGKAGSASKPAKPGAATAAAGTKKKKMFGKK